MKVLCFGSLNIDHVYSLDHIVQKGETIGSRGYHIYPGGKGLNQAVALGRAGVETYHAGAIGREGGFLLEILQDAGVNTELVSVLEDVSTGHAIIQNDATGDNCIILYDGANKRMPEEYVQKVLCQFEAGDWIVLQNEINNLELIMKNAHDMGMRIVLNPAPMDESVEKLPLEYVDYLVVNEIEAGQLLGVENDAIDQMCGLFMQKMIAKRVILTLGSQGSKYIDTEEQKVLSQDAVAVEAVDTTAAGDTFIGYFVAGIMKGMAADEAIAIASRAAAITVTRPGASVSIPGWNELV